MDATSHVSDLVRVLAADINEKLQADGPVVDHMPNWFKDASHAGRITLVRVHESDYAHFRVSTPMGEMYAGPGDAIKVYIGDTLKVLHEGSPYG